MQNLGKKELHVRVYLDAKFRKERAARKSVRKEQQQESVTNENVDEYEYEYVDDPPVEEQQQQIPPMNPLFQRRPRINIRDY